jgi:hypothetical protein
LTRESLEPEFFSQCYANAPFALLVSLSATVWQYPSESLRWTAIALVALSAIAFIAVQIAWFRKSLGDGIAAAAARATVGYLQSIAFMIALGWLVQGGG